MKHSKIFSITSMLISSLSGAALIASTLPPTHLVNSPQQPIEAYDEEDILSSMPEEISADSTLLGNESLVVDDDALDPPSDEVDTNIEDDGQAAVETKVEPDVRKVLYDPNMNYGKGAPVPKPTPATTVKRNLIVLGSSVIMATIAMLVVASNKGLDAPSTH